MGASGAGPARGRPGRAVEGGSDDRGRPHRLRVRQRRRLGRRPLAAGGPDLRATSASPGSIVVGSTFYALPANPSGGPILASQLVAGAANRQGGSLDPKADAAVRFAAKVVRERGHVSDADVQAVRMAGYDDAQIVEIVQHVALNTWTNYMNEVARTEIDFPAVTPAGKAA